MIKSSSTKIEKRKIQYAELKHAFNKSGSFVDLPSGSEN